MFYRDVAVRLFPRPLTHYDFRHGSIAQRRPVFADAEPSTLDLEGETSMNDLPRRTPADSLSLKIYAAFLGNAPRIRRANPNARPRLNLRVRLETFIEPTHLSPFYRPTFRETLGRAAGFAIQALEDARARLKSSNRQTVKPVPTSPTAAQVKPVVLIGPVVKKKSVGDRARAA
jgi:hypothetical protein